ncbi:carboxypeptidase regulatory-like domain-containing protein [Streptomyces cocklensis]|uniref:Galactose oxidase n=1 Tax=Actinacidiphila cocklensis TaxID=887465 RepID=A0A9W4DIG0_9ACTN|nr:carboxypeptidase regulatory-like domain-containing protein [Actinacidiphila cocklensis]MDD1058468.1 carboxypeptidase regulatory-like domain-containing protein [Actinacidiphila cocklensis]CAG6390623.1 Galactose oxidase [Actinacidiphila cocklensis]
MAITAVALLPAQAAFAAPQTASGTHVSAKPRVANAPAAGTAPSTARACDKPKPGQMSCFAFRRTDVKGIKGLLEVDTVPAGYGPSDLQSAYKLPANGGAGQTVAIVDAYDDPNAEADLAVYRQQYGLPACTTDNGCFTKVSQRGGTDDLPTPDPGWSQEISLDLDMVSAAAPNAHILLVEADTPSTDDLGTAVNEAVALGAKYVSNSYGSNYSAAPGSGEDESDLQADTQYFDHPGVVLTASTGDNAYGVGYPAASPHVTAVGGTSLVADSSARGWTESVWHGSTQGPGSGCSTIEPKPAFQKDTGCAHRTVADVSAVADPATGVAVYDSYQVSGWLEFGGTSASAPIIASVYADAGTPADGTYPNSYPYQNTSAINDVTTGSNGSCDPAYWCTATAGYDGPTGLGTPDGLAAFRTGPHGTVSGTVTSQTDGEPLAGATVTMGDYTDTTDATGAFSITAAPGTYTVQVSDFGYGTQTRTGISVTDGGSATESFSLDSLPTSTVSGTVTDGSGHGYPLYARITVDGMPGTVYTDPYTGAYSVKLPKNTDYTLHVAATEAGYQATDSSVSVADGDVTDDVAVPVDATGCTAAGYTRKHDGARQTFDATTAPADWTVTDATGNGPWRFDNPGARGNWAGGDSSGGFAVADSRFVGTAAMDTSLVSPVVDMSDDAAPAVEFNSDYASTLSNSTADVEVTTDGGQTWSSVWHYDTNFALDHFAVQLPQAAHKSAVQVRFHFTGSNALWWELDNVFIGDSGCVPIQGALVQGQVTDTNTGKGLAGAQVEVATDPATDAQTLGTTVDPALQPGFYSTFVPATGAQNVTATRADYSSASASVTLAADKAVRHDFALKAGRLAVTPGSVSKSLAWQGKTTVSLTVTNNGTATANAELTERTGAFTAQATGTGPALQRVPGSYSPYSAARTGQGGTTKTADLPVRPAAASGEPWSPIADYPVPVQDNMVETYRGKVYSIGGLSDTGILNSVYVYDPATGAWTTHAAASDGRYAGAHGLINGKIYVAGGWQAGGGLDPRLEIYDPATDSWSTGASAPHPLAGAASAVLDGKLYVVGGCGESACGSGQVSVYDPATNTWSSAPDYPEAAAWGSCGAVNGILYCAGGNQANGTADAFSFDPAQHAWAKMPSLPIDLWGSAYASANGKLLVSGGITGHSTERTNAGYAYDPVAGSWSALPNAMNAVYRGGSALGVYQVGGGLGGLNPPVTWAAVLPGYDQAEATGVSWLSESASKISLAPGETGTVTVTLDAATITQPGTYTASLALVSDTPYGQAPVPVTLTVAAPSSWGKLTGTVYSWNGSVAAPLAGATIQVNGALDSWTLRTDSNGHYSQWLDQGNKTLQIVVARDGYQPLVLSSSVTAGKTTTLNATLVAVGAAKGASTVVATVASTPYGHVPQVAVTVTGVASLIPTGQVTIKEGTTTLGSSALTAGGAATVSLPRTLKVGTHSLTVSYAGDSRLEGSVTSVQLVVTKGTAAVVSGVPAT